MTAQTLQHRRDERGNALFLILIAVALFAALSYAVTQSGKSGGGGTSRETATINSGLITDYPASIRTAATRMILTGAAVANSVDFRTTGYTAGGVAIFDPNGGGAVAVTPPSTGVDSTTTLAAGGGGATWRFKAIGTGATGSDNKGYYISGLGPTGDSGQDAFGFIGVNVSTCHAINTALGLNQASAAETGGAMTTTADANEANPLSAAHGSASATTAAVTNTIGKGEAALNTTAQSFACVSNSTTQDATPYIYYHAIIEQ
jgi:hypothetical protein